ncbi:MAG: aminodeoxychorismate synthase component I, partial [Longimicrobiales bacterium]|nr:aminodeoxychorismate synthase component I [Longimicrobiales bacterium]
MPRLLFDFPPRPGASPLRREFRDPVEVVRAAAVENVVPALTRIQRAVLEDGLTAAGYLAYEAAPAFDPAFRVRSAGEDPLVWFGLYEGAGEPTPSPRAPSSEVFRESWDWDLDLSPQDFAERVAEIRRAIEAGETYQVNFTARMRARPLEAAEGMALYEHLRRTQGEGYHALLETDDQVIVSASPELFFQLRGREVTVRPMKGTRPRGRWLEEDEALARELRSSEKEQAENRMIVDLLRNDLGRVAKVGSVRVPRVFDVERYRTVLQMTSTVTGTLPRGAGFVDVLRALFPSGSVTGAPKIQTMKLIAELESSPRDVYCGAIGYVEGGSGHALFNVPIRTLRIDRDSGAAVYGTGSGITWGSTAEEEYEEIRAKARILSEHWPDFDLLESLRLEGGGYRRLERHMTRMRDSARYFGRPFPEGAVREALGE